MKEVFTKEQLQYLEKVYDLSPVKDTELFQVRDGVVSKGDTFYWMSRTGVETVNEGNWGRHLDNLRKYGDCYSVQEPVILGVTYAD